MFAGVGISYKSDIYQREKRKNDLSEVLKNDD